MEPGLPALGSPMTRASVVLAFTFGGCALPRVPWVPLDRPAICLLGALLAIALRVVTLDEAYRAIDLRVLALLFGMMLTAGTLAEAGVYGRVGAALARPARERPRRVLALLLLASGALSAVVTNDTVCVFFAPLLITVCRRAGRRPMPYLLGLALAANTGSAATLVGNPQNAYIGIDAARHVAEGTSHLTFARYLVLALPVTLAGLVASYAAIVLLHRKDLGPACAPVEPSGTGPAAPYDPALARRAFLVLGVASVLFLRYDLSLVALVAAALTLLVANRDPRTLYARVDVGLLLLFGGLFVVTDGARVAGVIDALRDRLAPSSSAPFPSQAASMAAFTTVGSQLVSNVPFVLATTPWLDGLASPDGHRVLLALASTFAGNLTLLGSVANLIVAGAARADEPMGFVEHVKVGLPVTLVQVALSLGAVVLYQAWGLI